jgi:hypothetical protein
MLRMYSKQSVIYLSVREMPSLENRSMPATNPFHFFPLKDANKGWRLIFSISP